MPRSLRLAPTGARHPSRHGASRLPAVGGSIALVGSGPFTSALESIDRELLAATGRRRPRVVILAVTMADPAEGRRVAEMGRQHFAALGAEVEPVALGPEGEADDPANGQAVGEADLVYLVGSRADDVQAGLAGSAVGLALEEMHRRGGTLAACAAAATALGGLRLGPWARPGWPFRSRAGLGLLPGIAVVPSYDARPEVLRLPPILRAPRGAVVVGIDRETALLGDGLAWQVQGRGRVTVWRGRRRSRHRDGDIVRLAASDDPGPPRGRRRGPPRAAWADRIRAAMGAAVTSLRARRATDPSGADAGSGSSAGVDAGDPARGSAGVEPQAEERTAAPEEPTRETGRGAARARALVDR